MMDRINKLQKIIKSKNLDAMLITDPSNIYYLSGIRSVNEHDREFWLITDTDKAYIFTPKMYEEEVASRLNPGVEMVILERGTLTNYLKKYTKIGFESANLSFKEYSDLENFSERELMPQHNIVEDLRLIKEDSEIVLIKNAVEITDKTWEFISNEPIIGKSEIEVAEMIRSKFLELGAEGLAFDSIVASGPGSSLPHYRTSNKKIVEGILLVDMGAKFQGYCADMSRTIVLNYKSQKPNSKIEELFKDRFALVKKAHDEVIKNIKPGVAIADLCKIPGEIFGKENKYFIHSLGHGVGLNIHEGPALYPASEEKLQENMIITVEPGLYYPEWGGIRIESYIQVGKEGAIVLSNSEIKSSFDL